MIMEKKGNGNGYAEAMERLNGYVGKNVEVEYSLNGAPAWARGRLEQVNGFANIRINGMGIPFIGRGSAIVEIRDGSDRENILYKNPNIDQYYALRDMQRINEVVLKTFGMEKLQERISDMNKELRDE